MCWSTRDLDGPQRMCHGRRTRRGHQSLEGETMTLVPMDRRVKETPLTEGQYQALKGSFTVWRDILIAMMLKNTGVRIGELLALEVRDCVLAGPDYYIYVQRGKKDKNGQRQADQEYERLWLNPVLGVALRDYIKVADKGQPIGQGRVFQVSDRNVRYAFARAGERAIGRPVKPHELRGLYIRTMISGGANIELTADMVGHADYRTTQKHYYSATEDQRRYIGEHMPV